ncbi:MAG TPA: phage tail tube protein [Deltaproteobacteria bacterium]|nr:phage tail tube protein [Deltaproteobacteria bacterium]
MSIESQGTKLEISGTSGGAVTGCTPAAGNPTIFTKTSHGLSDGDVVTISGVTGGNAADLNKVWVVKYTTTNTFAVDCDSTGFTGMGSAAAATPLAWLEIGEVTDWDGPGGSATMYETTHLQSEAKEKKIGLMDEGQLTLSINWEPSDAGQQAAREARAARTEKSFRLTYTDNSTATFDGYVMGMSSSGGVDSKVSGSITIEISGPVEYA